MVFFGLITVVYAGSPLANVIAIIGIDATIGVLLYSGIALAVFTYLLMPKSAGETSHASILTDIKATLGNPKIIVASLLAGFMVGSLNKIWPWKDADTQNNILPHIYQDQGNEPYVFYALLFFCRRKK